MLKNLLDLLRKGDLVDQAVKETDDMFQDAYKLYDESVNIIKKRREPEFDIYQLDIKINSKEKGIRRKILENMSINPRQDIVASLVLTSIIIDIERIGDYSKNIYELANMCMTDSMISMDENLFKHADTVNEKFIRIGEVLATGDEDRAKKLMEDLDPIKKDLESYICVTIAKSEGAVNSSVLNVLFSRYLKRVAAHLSNIASSIANPFDLIGFYNKNNPDVEVD